MTRHGSEKNKAIAEKGLLLRTQVGSPVHGLNVKEQDDRDEMGLCLEPPEHVVGFGHFEQYEYRTQPDHHRSGPGDLDLVVYSLRKWLRLALKGNPTVTLPLFVEDKEVVFASQSGRYLRDHRKDFLTMRTVRAHLGYLHNQRERMRDAGGKGKDVTRPELIEAYGFDTKYAGHMVRLGVQGLEILMTGNLVLPMAPAWRSTIRGIRTGEYTQDEILEMAEDLEETIKVCMKSPEPVLPEEPATSVWEEWMIDLYYWQWGLTPVIRKVF